MAVEAEDAAEELLAEAVHYRHGDDERRDAERDPRQRENGDDRDEAFLAARAQVAEGDQALERTKGHQGAATRLSAASAAISLRSPLLRFFTSTTLLATPRGPMTS